MSLSRKLAGYTLISASLGLSVISGFVSNAGLSQILPAIPFVGMLGFVVAVALVGLSVGVSAELSGGQYAAATILIALLAGIAEADRRTNEIALNAQVVAATQEASDRNVAYTAAKSALDSAQAEIASLESRKADLAAALADNASKADIRIAQNVLFTEGQDIAVDGALGRETRGAISAYAKTTTKRLQALQVVVSDNRTIVAGGEAVIALPFDAENASLYAALITAFSVVLSFAGGYLANENKALAERIAAVEAGEEVLEAAADEADAMVADLTDWKKELFERPLAA